VFMFAILSPDTESAEPFDTIPEIPENRDARTVMFVPPNYSNRETSLSR